MNSGIELLIEDITRVWDPSRFSIPHRPYSLGYIGKERIESKKPDVLDMPIKMPFEDFKIPFGDDVKYIVQKCAEFEREINPEFDKYFCYLTMNQGVVPASTTQRNAGVHFDGMQGTRYQTKIPVCHQYVLSSALPTKFYEQAFNTDHLDEARDNWFDDFAKQAKSNAMLQPDECELMLMTAYCPHEATYAQEDTYRTFMRIEFTLKEFDRVGNTRNPLINTGWKYVPRPIPSFLT